MGYISRKYLREKFEILENAMRSLDIYNAECDEDRIPEEEMQRYFWSIDYSMNAIRNEVSRCVPEGAQMHPNLRNSDKPVLPEV